MPGSGQEARGRSLRRARALQLGAKGSAPFAMFHCCGSKASSRQQRMSGFWCARTTSRVILPHVASEDCYAELKEELQELKQSVKSVVAELWKLKVQVQSVELKVAEETRKYHVVLDCSVVSPIVLGLLGILIGVLVAGLWK